MSRSLLRRIAAAAGIAAVAAVAAFIAPQAASAETDGGLYGGYSLDCSGPVPVLHFSGTLTSDNMGHNSGPSSVTAAIVSPDGTRTEFARKAITLPYEYVDSWELADGPGTYSFNYKVGDGLRFGDYQSATIPEDCPTEEPTTFTPPAPTFEQIVCHQQQGPQTRVSLPTISSSMGTYTINGTPSLGGIIAAGPDPIVVGFVFGDNVVPPLGWPGLPSFTPAPCATITSFTAAAINDAGVRSIVVSGTADLPYVTGEALESLHVVITASNGATVSVPVGADGTISAVLTGDFADGAYDVTAQLFLLVAITEPETTSVTFVGTPTPSPTATLSPTASPTTSPTATPTASATASPTPSVTPSVSPTAAGPVATLSVNSVAPGGRVAVSGSGFAPNEPIELWLHSTPVRLWSGSADASGAFSQVVTIAADTALGAHRIEVRGATSATQWLDLTVKRVLAATGSDGTAAAGIGVVALLLVAAGGIAMLRIRKNAPTA